MAISSTRRLLRLHGAVDRLRKRDEATLLELRATAARLEAERDDLFTATSGVGALSLYVDLLARRMGALEGALAQSRNDTDAAAIALRAQEQRLKMIERMSVTAAVAERREDERKALEDWLDTVRQASEKLHEPP
jgi:hypothetical protein